MFSVLFEVNPHGEQWDNYLGLAKMLRPELEQIDGFVDNIRYRSLTRDGWILSLSNWRDEKSLVRWRTRARHHDVQAQGREAVLADYHLRVGQITRDTRIPTGHTLTEQRLDETETGAATTVTLLDGNADDPDALPEADIVARQLGLDTHAAGLVSWDVYDAVLNPGNLILTLDWRDHNTAERAEANLAAPAGNRRRRVRIVRDYSMYDRRETPQYYPEPPAAPHHG